MKFAKAGLEVPALPERLKFWLSVGPRGKGVHPHNSREYISKNTGVIYRIRCLKATWRGKPPHYCWHWWRLRVTYPDGITRFIGGKYNMLVNAQEAARRHYDELVRKHI